MTFCIKPRCENPENHKEAIICTSCGSKLLLRERYRAIKPLGKGGFGRTFLAVDEDIPSQPQCVIKQFYFLTDDDESQNKAATLFRQEAVHLERLGKHPQIPTLLAYFQQENQLYLVQELIDGQNLKQELKLGLFNESPIERVLQLLNDILPVLQFIHERQVIHRDIKPDNIMRRNCDRQLVLIDFGIAKLLTESAMNRTGTVVGSQNYAPLEQLKGKVFPASDLYSLGVTCIQLLTGVVSPADMYDSLNHTWHWREYLTAENQVSDSLGKILDKLLASKISERYQSAKEVLQDLQLIDFDDIETEISSLPTQSPKLENDQTDLERLLIAKKWKEADRETWKMLCLALGKLPETHLEVRDIDHLPCEILQIIDSLWVKYSQGRFGFTIQKQIYESVKKDYINFCHRVNWPSYNSNNYYQGLKFNQNAPMGHLPSRIWVTGTTWLRHAGAMASRLDKCNI